MVLNPPRRAGKGMEGYGAYSGDGFVLRWDCGRGSLPDCTACNLENFCCPEETDAGIFGEALKGVGRKGREKCREQTQEGKK